MGGSNYVIFADESTWNQKLISFLNLIVILVIILISLRGLFRVIGGAEWYYQWQKQLRCQRGVMGDFAEFAKH